MGGRSSGVVEVSLALPSAASSSSAGHSLGRARSPFFACTRKRTHTCVSKTVQQQETKSLVLVARRVAASPPPPTRYAHRKATARQPPGRLPSLRLSTRTLIGTQWLFPEPLALLRVLLWGATTITNRPTLTPHPSPPPNRGRANMQLGVSGENTDRAALTRGCRY